jgi:hypothetical protein
MGMDYATILAMRAIVRALTHGEHVKDDFSAHVVASLNDAIDKADADEKRGAVVLLEELREGIEKDARLLGG